MHVTNRNTPASQYQCEGRVAQLEERGVCNAEAWGSNPHASTPQPLIAGTEMLFLMKKPFLSLLLLVAVAMHPETRVTGEGPRVTDSLRSCIGFAFGR